jgi:inorganic pyrophosphatase
MHDDSPEKITPNMLFRSHPWHGVSIGEHAPDIVNCYIEMVPTDTVKYELDKTTGILKVDRPQKYSSLCPTLYGFIPQTYCGDFVAKHCIKKTGDQTIRGDGDPMDICVLTEKVIPRGDIILKAHPIGGFRMLDANEADDKIIAVMHNDFVYGKYTDVHELHDSLIERMRHYFLTYKDMPESEKSRVKITHIYGAKEAHEIIKSSQQDYAKKFGRGGI